MKMQMNSFPLASVETLGVSPDIFQQCFALKRIETVRNEASFPEKAAGF